MMSPVVLKDIYDWQIPGSVCESERRVGYEQDKWTKEEAGDKHLVSLTAGPAGENLTPFACLTSEAYRIGKGVMIASFDA